MAQVKQLTTAELEAGLDAIRRSPKDEGVLELIVRRPRVGAREVLEEGQLDLGEGLAGDNWRTRGSAQTSDGSSHPNNSPVGRQLQMRGVNAKVVQGGVIRVGDVVRKQGRREP